MIAKLWIWIGSIFPKSKIGIIFGILFSKATNRLILDILDTENQKKAYEFVKELNQNTELTNQQKAFTFNVKMLEWAKKEGKNMAESVVNCLRELAINAVKAQN